MNLTDIITRVQRAVGDDNEILITQADIVRWANDGQIDVARRTKILSKKSETTTVANLGEYTLPADFLQVDWVKYNGRVLTQFSRESVDYLAINRDNTPIQGDPEAYYTEGLFVYLFPVPTVAITNGLDIRYYYMPATLVLATQLVLDIPVFMHEDVVRYCIARAKERDEDWAAASYLQSDYEARSQRARGEATDRNSSYPSVTVLPGDMGGYAGGDDW